MRPSFIVLAAVATVMSFNLTASLLCCRSLSRRVDRLEDRLDTRIDRVEQRLERLEQIVAQLVLDMALMKNDLGLIKAQLGISVSVPESATALPPGTSSSAAAQ